MYLFQVMSLSVRLFDLSDISSPMCAARIIFAEFSFKYVVDIIPCGVPGLFHHAQIEPVPGSVLPSET